MILPVCIFQGDYHTRLCDNSHFYPSPQLDSVHMENRDCVSFSARSQHPIHHRSSLSIWWMKKAQTDGQIKSISHYECISRPLELPQTPNKGFSGTCCPEDINADVALDTRWQSQALAPMGKHTWKYCNWDTVTKRKGHSHLWGTISSQSSM